MNVIINIALFTIFIALSTGCTTKGARTASVAGTGSSQIPIPTFAPTPSPTASPMIQGNNTGNTNNQNNGLFYWQGNGQNITNAPGTGDQVQAYSNGGSGTGSTVIPTIVALSAWRCELMGDSVGQADPDGDGLPDWKERQLWAEKCFNGSNSPLPNYMPWLTLGRNAYRADGTPLALYPTFGTVSANGQAASFPAPIESTAACNPALWSNYVLIAFCTPGCYSPEQTIQASMSVEGPIASYLESKPMEIAKAQNDKVSHVVTLSPGSSLDKLQFHSSPTEYVSDMVAASPKPQPFISFAMASGKSLRVTPDHPIVDADGIMRAAKTLELGESLFTADGGADKIVNIVHEQLPVAAHNVVIRSRDPMQSLVVAGGGYINGDLKIQRQEIQWLNRALDRRNVPSEVVAP